MSRSNLRTAAISLMVLASCFVLNHDFALAQTPQLKAANNRIEAAEKAGNWEEMVRLMPSWVNGRAWHPYCQRTKSRQQTRRLLYV